jgi:Flp pilus assembly protein TadG
MRRLASPLRRSDRGQAMVEFALVAQVFLLLCFLIYQGGVAWFQKLNLEQGTRDAARKAIVSRSLTSAGIKTVAEAAERQTANQLDQAKLRVTVSGPASATWAQGDLVTVESWYPYSIGIFGIAMSGDLYSKTTLRME